MEAGASVQARASRPLGTGSVRGRCGAGERPEIKCLLLQDLQVYSGHHFTRCFGNLGKCHGNGSFRGKASNVNESEGESVGLPTGNRWHTCARMTRGGTAYTCGNGRGHDNSAVAGASPLLGPEEGDGRGSCWSLRNAGRNVLLGPGVLRRAVTFSRGDLAAREPEE